jgi:AcrR family transcriptional regulator
VNVRSTDDRTARARIRDAAIDLVAREGTGGLSARRVAEEAGVSPGSVIHHFGSMDGLRSACDDHVAEVIRSRKSDALKAGPGLDVGALLQDQELHGLPAYLAAVVADDSPAVTRLVDEMVQDAAGYFAAGVRSGMLRAADAPDDRAALLVVWSLGALVLHRHIARHLGVDLTDPGAPTTPQFTRYMRAVSTLYGEGLFTESFAAAMNDALSPSAHPREESV